MKLIFALISLSVLASGGSVHKWHGLFDPRGVQPQEKSNLISPPFFTAPINNQNGRFMDRQNVISVTTTTDQTTAKPTSLEPSTLNTSKPLAADEFYYLKYFFDRRLFNPKPNHRPTHEGSQNRRLAHIRIFRRPTHDGLIHSRSTHVDKIVKRPTPNEVKNKIRTPIDDIDNPTPRDNRPIKNKIRTPVDPKDAIDSPTPRDTRPIKNKIRTPVNPIDAIDSPTPRYTRPIKNKIRTPVDTIDAIDSPAPRDTKPNDTIHFRPTSNVVDKMDAQNGTVQSRTLKDIYMTPTYNGTSYKRQKYNDTVNIRPKHIDPIYDTQGQNDTEKRARNSASKISTPYSIKCKRHERYIGLRPMLNVIKFLSFL